MIITKTPDWLTKLAEDFQTDETTTDDGFNDQPPESQPNDFFQPPEQDVENIVEAEVNLDDLDKIMWNDEMFRVQFNNENQTAVIYNQYGNTVATINATTIEEVDEQLNANRVVVTIKDYRKKI